MVHLMTRETFIGALVMALITFFATPYFLLEVTGLTSRFNDPCLVGFIVGFGISVLLWHFHIKKLVYKK